MSSPAASSRTVTLHRLASHRFVNDHACKRLMRAAGVDVPWSALTGPVDLHYPCAVGLRRTKWELLDRSSPLFGPVSLSDGPSSRRDAAAAAASRLAEPWEPEWRQVRAICDAKVPPFALVSVYRRRNFAVIAQLVEEVPDKRVALWALDESHPQLQHLTVGVGGGNRFVLLNRLTAWLSLPDDSWVVVADDDVRFLRGSLPETVLVADAAGFDIAAPSNARWSFVNWDVCRHRVGAIARRTTFVDQGPLLVISAAARSRVLPFREDIGMGWGVEATWRSAGLSLGVVDATTMLHIRPAGGSYDIVQAGARGEDLRREAGTDDTATTSDTWWFWQRTPPWTHS